MNSLRSRLQDLATSFADDVLTAIRTASIDELVDGRHESNSAPRRAPGRPRGSYTDTNLVRRTPADVERTLGLLVAALQIGPLRAQEITAKLGIPKRQLPRVIALGLSTKRLKKKGRRRGTTYLAV